MATFDLPSYLRAQFQNVKKTPEALREAANAVLQGEQFFGAIGNTSPVTWAREALKNLDEYDKLSPEQRSQKQEGLFIGASPDSFNNLQKQRSAIMRQRDSQLGRTPAEEANYQKQIADITQQINNMSVSYEDKYLGEAYRWITGEAQGSKAKRVLQRAADSISDITSKLQNEFSNIANISDLPANATAEQRAAAQKAADERRKNLEPWIATAQMLGIDTTPAMTRTSSGYVVKGEEPKTPAAPSSSSSGSNAAAASASVAEGFTPTEYSSTAGLSDLQKKVMGTDANLNANDAYINGVFKAFHNRDATAEELAYYRSKKTGAVRTEIIGGAQAAGLPTVKPGTVNVPTGVMTPEEAKTQGLQKVLRPDQLSAFTEDQIIRDNRGGIYLNPNTTTEAQRSAVASGKSGNSMAKVEPAVVGTPSAPAEELERAASAPDAGTFVDTFSGGANATPAEQAKVITDTSVSYLSSVIAGYDKQIADLQAQIDKSRGDMSGLTGRLEGISRSTPNADALEKARELEGVREKQAVLVDIQKQIALEQERLNLGLINEGNKLAPLSIIGRRQATLQEQGLARIGALTSIAQVYQGDLEFALSMVDATVTAMNNDRQLQLSALDTLISLKEKEILSLTDEEGAVIEARQESINLAIETSEDHAKQVFDLIKDNPEAALRGGVTFADSPAMALSKMAPYLAEAAAAKAQSDRKTQVVDLGGKKVLIDSGTGEVIQDYTEVATPGDGSTWKDVTRDDGSVVRVFLDEFGYPTGEQVDIFGTDDTAKLDEFKKETGEWVAKLSETDAQGNPTATWEQARNSLHATYSEVPMEVIDKWLAGGVTINQSKDWKNISEFLVDYPGLKYEAEYLQGLTKTEQGGGLLGTGVFAGEKTVPMYTESEVIRFLERKYQPSFSDVGADTNTGANSVAAVQKLTASFPEGRYAGQCGAFVNDVLGTRLGDSYENKLAKTNSSITAASAQPGDFFVMPYKDTGHTGIIVNKKARSDGTYDYLVIDSNYGLNERISYHTINSSRITGFGRTTIKKYTSRYSA